MLFEQGETRAEKIVKGIEVHFASADNGATFESITVGVVCRPRNAGEFSKIFKIFPMKIAKTRYFSLFLWKILKTQR